jgi:hypothetical protein
VSYIRGNGFTVSGVRLAARDRPVFAYDAELARAAVENLQAEALPAASEHFSDVRAACDDVIAKKHLHTVIPSNIEQRQTDKQWLRHHRFEPEQHLPFAQIGVLSPARRSSSEHCLKGFFENNEFGGQKY